jgi:hypothetical protein
MGSGPQRAVSNRPENIGGRHSQSNERPLDCQGDDEAAGSATGQRLGGGRGKGIYHVLLHAITHLQADEERQFAIT